MAGVLSFVSSSFKNEKVNRTIFISFCLISFLLFSSELIYFSIYESFFSFNGIQFVGALKDGYDKVLLTIIQNIVSIFFFLLPVGFFIMTKVSIPKMNKVDSFIIVLFIFICGMYSLFSINFINKNNTNSLYDLVYQKNLPILNVKKMGLFASTSLSLERKLFGFSPSLKVEKDILSNQRTALREIDNNSYNVDSSIDFNSLIKNEGNETIRNIHTYFSNQTPILQNKYTGIFQDKNLILILAESFDEIAINKDLTPTLYKIKNEGIVFDNYFAPKYPASTADGEYMLEWATLPIIGENYSLIDMVYNTNPYILPRVLKNYQYKTYVYHDYWGNYNRRSTYFSTLNFDGYRYCGEGIDTRCEFFHGSDMDMMDQTPDDFVNQDKFFTYYITLSGHGSYDGSNFVAEKHMDRVRNLPYSYQIKYYLAANIDFDLAMEKLINKLEKANKLNDTVIVISSDHSPYYLSNYEVNFVSPLDRDNKFDRNRGSLIIYNAGYKGGEHIKKYAMNIDVLPTLLNMFNIPYDSRIIIGKDIMAPNNDGVVVFPDRSWVNEKGSYDSTNGHFNRYVDQLDDKYITKMTNDVNDKYNV